MAAKIRIKEKGIEAQLQPFGRNYKKEKYTKVCTFERFFLITGLSYKYMKVVIWALGIGSGTFSPKFSTLVCVAPKYY